MSDYLDDAAAAALYGIDRKPTEHIGVVYEDRGALRSTPPASRDMKGRAEGVFAIPKGSLRALYHNHPNEGKNRSVRAFSEDDKNNARQFGVPSYISVGHEILRWAPDGKGTQPVLAQLPVEQIRQLRITPADNLAARLEALMSTTPKYR